MVKSIYPYNEFVKSHEEINENINYERPQRLKNHIHI